MIKTWNIVESGIKHHNPPPPSKHEKLMTIMMGTTDYKCTVMAIALMTLWVRWAKNINKTRGSYGPVPVKVELNDNMRKGLLICFVNQVP